jgi:TonB-linked SusC/RagA family outer membrane protein
VGQVTGMVTSEAGQPLAGAQVTIQGTQLGARTVSTGRYTITSVPPGQHIVRTVYIGYAAQERTVMVTAGSSTVADFSLSSRATVVSDVVVVGYGTQAREEVTGSVKTITKEDFIKGPARDAASMIAGKIPGLVVTTPSGSPTAGTQISLRGMSTIRGSTSPLVLVDGVPASLQTVAAEDIESITVLKDGSAAAIYGTRGSNGVILITTKRHDGGAPTIRYDGYTSVQTIYNQPDFLTAADYRRLIDQGHAFTDLGGATDWQDQILRNPMSHRHNVTLSGGADNTNYSASLNYESTEGILIRSNNREVTGRANIRHSMFDGKLEADASLLSRSQSNFTGPSFNGAWRQALIRNPTDSVTTPDGAWRERGVYMYSNPVGLIQEHNGEAETTDQRLHGTLTLRPIDNLRLSLMGGTSRSSFLSGNATTFRHVSTTQSGQNGTAGRSTSAGLDRILEITGTYQNTLFGSHDITLLGGYEYQDFEDESFNASNSDFPTDLFGFNQLQTGTSLSEGTANIGSSKSGNTLIGFFSRLNYDWQNRFLLMGSVRYEGSSRFGADHKWGMFPAISAGWNLTEERFMDAVPVVSNLKVRAGYGVTGIAPSDSYLSLTSYDYGGRFLFNGQWVQGLSPSRNPNPDLRWEEKHERNVGVEFSLFDFRLSGSLDVYKRDTRDMLYEYSVPVPPYLFNRILANVGRMRNSGMEAELSYDVLDRDRLRWTTSANWSTNRNKLVSLSDDTFRPQNDFFYEGHTGEPIQLVTHRIDVGGPIGNFYGYKSVDIDDNGEWIVLNQEGLPIPISTVTEDDRRVLGNGVPKHYAAWNNTVQWRNFDFSANMRGAFGFQILNFQRLYYENPSILEYNMLRSAFDPVYGKLKPDGTPRTVNNDLVYVSYYIEDGDYWKLDNATLGYTFSPGTLGRLSSVVSGARLYVSGRNLLTLTGYKGMDPEVSVNGFSPGTDNRDTYPTTRMFTAGLTISF